MQQVTQTFGFCVPWMFKGEQVCFPLELYFKKTALSCQTVYILRYILIWYVVTAVAV